MRPYEIVLIIDPSQDEDGINAVVRRATDLITAQGGTPGRIERWGRRRLAYEIDHKHDGFYVLIEASGVPANMAAVDRGLFLTDEIIRHKVILVPPVAAGRRLAPPPVEEPAPAAS
jgi:small subunit ribosomal protein S6